MNRTLTINEVAQQYRISKSTIYRLIRNDPQFPWLNIGQKKKFILFEDQLKRWLHQRSIKQEIIKLPSQTIVIRRFINGEK
ncbi:MAG: helix-turn-helix transcriptional regulator [Bacteriovoracaceae bacterium]